MSTDLLSRVKEPEFHLTKLFYEEIGDEDDDSLFEEFPQGIFSPSLQSMVLCSPKQSMDLPFSLISLDQNSCLSIGYEESDKLSTIKELSLSVSSNALLSASACISPMIGPVRDPFYSSLHKKPPALLLHQENERNSDYDLSESPSPSPDQAIQIPSVSIAIEHPKTSLCMPPNEYGCLKFSITTYRWQPIEDCLGGVPIVEIRPYNKSDGKRYLYIKVDGIEETYSRCRQNGVPFPKARFMVESCCESSHLGYLSIRETLEGRKEEDYSDSDKMNDSQEEADDKSKYAVSEEEGPLKEVIQLNRNLTLLASENIVRLLDSRNFGRGSPVEEHKLRIVVILLPDPDESMTAEEQVSAGFEVASLPFYRIKRRAKRRRGKNNVEIDEEDDENEQNTNTSLKRFRLDNEKADISTNVDISKPMPLINTAPKGPHFVDFYCAICGFEQSIKLIDSSEIFYVSSSANEIWTYASTSNCRLDCEKSNTNEISNQSELSCRFCRSKIGNYFRDGSSLSSYLGFSIQKNRSIMRFRFVHPHSSTPLLFYRFSQQIRISDAEKLYVDTTGDFNSTESQLSLWMQGKIQEGWIGRPLLASEFPKVPGGYKSLRCVSAIKYSPVSTMSNSPECDLLALLHDLECDTDAAWTCRALLPRHDRQRSLSKLRQIAENPDVRKMVYILNSGSRRLSSFDLKHLRVQLFALVYSMLFE
jgi:hypothetical protein